MSIAEKLGFEAEKENINVSKTERKSVNHSEKPSRPLRRFGIEVDKVEDVGVTVMCDGIYPTQCMTMEEYLSIPEEIRNEAKAKMKHFFDNAETLLPEAIKKAVRKQIEKGIPISYGDKDGNVLRRYPDGRIFLANIDLETFETTETFLRMATPEDDYWNR